MVFVIRYNYAIVVRLFSIKLFLMATYSAFLHVCTCISNGFSENPQKRLRCRSSSIICHFVYALFMHRLCSDEEDRQFIPNKQFLYVRLFYSHAYSTS